MNIGEGNDMNDLLGWILGSRANGKPVAEHDARAAAARLADRANAAIMCGYTADRVVEAWAMPLGVCSLCPTRVRAGELVAHIREQHLGVVGGLPVVDVNDGPARAAVSDGRDRLGQLADGTPFDWNGVQVGDPTPCWIGRTSTSRACDHRDVDNWWCTREPDHPAPHVACDGTTVIAVWS